ncbi:peptidase M24, structural domain-containing protein [Armillaria borealis]|uniref:Peptidase M24, structural domain-containing protein n=1 Tax=Armillaria borealis TaxID=47425 RepID=A0AA39MHC7_9AGAR|nr:peptidase M24, structural domain-containing protein [Armillaria borealis]
MTSQTPVDVPSLGMTLGVLYIGATIAAILFGITNTQVAKYYKKYPDDWWIFRYSVGILWTFDALHVALSTHMIYHYLIDLFGDYDGLHNVIWSFKLQLLIEMIIVVGVQGIYIIRIWKLSYLLSGPRLCCVNNTTFILGRELTASAYINLNRYFVSDFKALPGVEVSISIITAIPVFSDFVIALSMCYYLHKSRQASGFSKTSDMLLGMMRLGVISGLATSVFIRIHDQSNALKFISTRYLLLSAPRLNSRKVRTNGASSESKVVALTYPSHDSGTELEVAHIGITMENKSVFSNKYYEQQFGIEGTVFVDGGIRHFIVDELRTVFSKATVIAAPTEIRQRRERKSEGELELLKCANEATLLAIRHTHKHMHIVIRESDALVARALVDVGLNNGGCLTLFGKNAALPHGSGTDCRLHPDDFALFDCTVSLHGYWSDVTCTLALPASSIPDTHNFVHSAQYIAFQTAHAGVPVVAKRVDEAPRLFLGLAGYAKYFTHCLGHGIGLEVHEDPYLNGGRTSSSRQGMLSNEPGVYIEGKVGVRLEDCFYIAQDGGAVYLTAGVGGPASSPWKP